MLGRPMSKNGVGTHEVKKIKPEWQKYYNYLLELREQLLHQMNGLAKESAQEMAGSACTWRTRARTNLTAILR